jgi:hypothetical protein
MIGAIAREGDGSTGEIKQYEATGMVGATLKQEAIAGEAAPVAPSEAGKGRGWPR